MTRVFVTGSFDDIRSADIRFLQQASALGNVSVLLWSDEAVKSLTGAMPKFSEQERHYCVQSIRYVRSVDLVPEVADPQALTSLPPGFSILASDTWAVSEAANNEMERSGDEKRDYCRRAGISYRVVKTEEIAGFPQMTNADSPSKSIVGRPRVIVSGTFDWLHSGHIRFFEEAASYGRLCVVVGHDANIRLLKGEGHPLFPQQERRYVVGSIRYVDEARISSGNGWLDAEPEVRSVKPDIFIVNEDGDKPEKRDLCERVGIQYLVLKRTPRKGLPRRASTDLRGF